MVVVVVVVVVDGAWFPLAAQPAVSAPIAIRAAPPASATIGRPMRFELMIRVLFVNPDIDLATTKSLALWPSMHGWGRVAFPNLLGNGMPDAVQRQYAQKQCSVPLVVLGTIHQ